MQKKHKSVIVFSLLTIIFSLIFAIALGVGIAYTENTINTENFTEFETVLPTKLLDINGELITEFTSEEKRELISLNEIPQHMKDALISREDRIFYEHKGFSVKALFRAVAGQLLKKQLGGGSTLTQQLAGTLYCDRREKSVKRKLRELWWSIQMERRYSKNELLELYLNRVYFGGGTYGVNAASKYYFGHDARHITPAESAILVIQLSNPAGYNPFEHPNVALERQKDVLKVMVSEGYITQAQADDSFDDYWLNFDYTRTDTSAFFMRDDKAPWFSEYVRRELADMIYGDANIYTSGLTVNTTGNIYHLQTAAMLMEKAIHNANRDYKAVLRQRQTGAFKTYVPMSELITLLFDLKGLKMSNKRVQTSATNTFTEKINPIVDILSLMFGIDNLKVGIINKANNISQEKAKSTTIEGTMVNIENDTGYITALVGGSKFDQSNQFIRATQARVQPGSSFKPLYFSAAIDSKKFTSATRLNDAPYAFETADGNTYLPNNYGGAWRGDVLLWRALALSLNIPALKVLEGIGFDAAIKRSVDLLGIPEKELPTRAFIPGYPLGLGTVSVRPIEMARAYAIFANGGKAVKPTAIRTVEDKNGVIILEPAKDVRAALRKPQQVISKENSFIMTKLLEGSVTIGTLNFGSQNRSSLIDPSPTGSKFTFTDKKTGKSFNMPVAGKTGTTQNWGDGWAIGYTPYYTAAFWFGFDTPGKSMGMNMTGASLAGPPWGDFMRAIHKDLPYKGFPEPPENGVVKATVCADSGLLPLDGCGSRVVSLWFLKGTVPNTSCDIHGDIAARQNERTQDILENAMLQAGYSMDDLIQDEDNALDLNLDFLDEGTSKNNQEKEENPNNENNSNQEETQNKLSGEEIFNLNYVDEEEVME